MPLEIKRRKLEELDVIEQAVSERFRRNPSLFPLSTAAIDKEYGIVLNTNKKRPLKEVVLQQQELGIFIEKYHHIQEEAQKEQISDIEAIKNDTDFSLFNEKFSDIINAHKNKIEQAELLEQEYSMGGGSDEDRKTILSKRAKALDIDKVFTVEESYGRYVDLIEMHEKWMNLPLRKDTNKASYLAYLEVFDKIGLKFEGDELNPNADLERGLDYKNYVQELAEYLKRFYIKTRVLENPERAIAQIEKEYEDKEWESLQKYIKPRDPLHCEACNKTFAKESVYKAHLTGKKHIKNAQKSSSSTSDSAFEKELSLYEYMVRNVSSLLEKEISNTKLNVERKQALTNKDRKDELLAQMEEIGNEDFPVNLSEEEESEESEDEDSNPNPLNLPLDVDGKPIPYWLWKLQGLGKQFQCEICGNATYQGRKIFEGHFIEQRHIHGLKQLGVSLEKEHNSEILLSFKGITKIDDALALWSKVKKEKVRANNVEIENIVEVEDDEGNVMSKKVYEDLQKQGLL